ncbi:hypothetical protein [Massilimicrobiota timonensis]|uniref:hypothetical protein n=1 Tax=Massilimicrobiota timonensis TaxID=1776392 RepID=UPI001961819C|nr:hypothetical protein [Massilimicrobiota timonensis]MBM6966122.1 hypothetical protein [Massilimicrobiota timonensis]
MNEERYEDIKRMVIKNETLEQNIFIQYLLENIDDFIGKQLILVILILIEMIGFLLIVIWKLLS